MATEKSANLQTKLAKIQRDAEERDAERRAAAKHLPYVNLVTTPVSLEALKLVPEHEAKAAEVAGLELKVHELALACYDPSTPAALAVADRLKEHKYEIKYFVVSRSSLAEAWKLYQFVPPPSEGITGAVSLEQQKIEGLLHRLTNFQAVQKELSELDIEHTTTTALFQVVVAGALGNRASDVHLEAGEHVSKIRFRIDGLLHDVSENLPTKNFNNIVSRIKLLAGLKINVREEPQDGRFTVNVSGEKEIEVRVSIIPSEFGETIVMRILDPDAVAVELSSLGLRADDLMIVERELAKPNGLILNTGPTGSGKTTTLYAFLKHIATPESKTITIEDPIEYHVAGIEQTQIDPEAGYTFASGLKSILRQDPDVILVGEIRDQETADIALQAALTGHLVFSTLHANDAVGAVPRLVDLGVKPATIGPALSLVIAQRLVRALCVECKKELPFEDEMAKKIKAFLGNIPERVQRAPFKQFLNDGGVVYKAVGCAVCNGFGYKGRIGIFELLETTPQFGEVVLHSPSEVALKAFAEQQYMVTMQEDGILKVLGGVTTFDEVEKVTGPIPWEKVEIRK